MNFEEKYRLRNIFSAIWGGKQWFNMIHLRSKKKSFYIEREK